MTNTVYHLADQETLAAITARNVRGWMGRERWSGRRLAPILGMSDVALSRRLRGEVDFTVTEIFNLAEVFGVDVDELLPQRKNAPHPAGPDGALESRLGESNPRPIHYKGRSASVVSLDAERARRSAAAAIGEQIAAMA